LEGNEYSIRKKGEKDKKKKKKKKKEKKERKKKKEKKRREFPFFGSSFSIDFQCSLLLQMQNLHACVLCTGFKCLFLLFVCLI
jgi:hypothetical protein